LYKSVESHRLNVFSLLIRIHHKSNKLIIICVSELILILKINHPVIA